MSTPKLAAKMVLAMKAIDAVAKNGKNDKQGYKYVQAADVAHEVRKALIDNGIAFDYSVLETERWDKATSSGGSMACVQVKVAATFTDQESGESRTVNSIGWGMDSLDKAPYKAMTGAVKYALRMNFLIPDDADPENDSGDQTYRGKAQVQPINALNVQLGASLAKHARPADDDLSFLNDDRPPVDYQFSEEAYRNDYQEPAAPPVAKKSGAVISQAQSKRFFAMCMGSGKSKPEVNHYLASRGYAASTDILKAEYEDLCSWAAAK